MRSALLSALLLCGSAHAAVSAKSYIVTDMSGTVLMERAADDNRAIASITKLITSENALHQASDELITITKEDIKLGRTRTPLKAGVAYSRGTLIELALVASDNVAAIALGRESTAHGIPENTTIVEASGLSRENRSSARAIAEYARTLYDTELAAVSVKPSTDVGKITKRSTNPLLEKQGWQFFLSKTGYIDEAGGCLVVITKIKEQILTIVILGAADTRQRWRDLVELRQELGDTDFYSTVKPKSKTQTKARKRRK